MLSAAMFYTFAAFVVAAITYLVSLVCYEQELKIIEKEDASINRNAIPLLIAIQTIKIFSKTHPVAGFVHACSFYYMLAAAPMLFFLMVLESAL
ncbi:MAG: hypothetical protein PHY62_00250 [Gallionella sp.]|nr:hypothetical protein [Gallionella sp.]